MINRRKTIYLLTLLALLTPAVHGQTMKTFKVKAGDYPNKVIPVAEQFQFPTFERGKILFYGGRTEEAPLNYTYLGGNLLFLNNQKDTLELLDQKLVKVVDMQGKIFYNDKQYGFCEMVSAFGDIKLAKKHILARIGNEKGGPYGISYTASSVTTYNSYSNEASPGARKLKMDTEAIFGHRTLYFFMDPNDRFLIPGKNSITRLFPKYKTEIAQYLKDNPVNFTQEEDLTRLLAFCQELK
ncbi:hypothetical protein [Dyadobacter sp. Leaf189]|uniref:hypothetical protein n=1 Tax=Dyadobacter sp. Leaf189 TaxID=1736295 RepID=UPI0006FF8257|nr:hypothetical protein [Dyadobacter sp. Leaf189]KQS28276.1 hypothetical protein ASG33_18065 [Dyadobacter sp. Leaf189]